MGLQGDQILDLFRTTLNELGEGKVTDISAELQDYLAMRRLLKSNKVVFDAGTKIQWDLIIDDNNQAQFRGLFAVRQIDVPDVMIQGEIPWRHVDTAWGVERREISMNRDPRKIVDIVKTRRHSAMMALAELLERRFWRAPASTDTDNPFGMPYWIVKSNTAVTTNNGFNGSVPSGFTTVANINPTTYARWKNYATQYTDVTKDDLIAKMRRAMTYTKFISPVDNILSTFNTGDDYGLYTNYAVLGTMESILESQNDNLGNDVASMDGKTLFRKTPVVWVPQLDEDTTNPVYGINWGEMKTVVLRGEWMREIRVDMMPNQPSVMGVWTDTSMNWICRNRRRNFVLATNTTMPA